jgi:hypothetical protein
MASGSWRGTPASNAGATQKRVIGSRICAENSLFIMLMAFVP